MTTSDAPILAYDESLSRDKLTIQHRDDGSLRIIIPPLRNWRTLPIGFWIGLAVLTLILGPWIVAGTRWFWFHWQIEGLIWIAVFAMPFALLLGVTWYRLGEHACLDVRDASLTLQRLHRGRIVAARTVPLALVREVRASDTGKLAIDVHAEDPIELFVSRSTPETRSVVDVLRSDLEKRRSQGHGAFRAGSRDC